MKKHLLILTASTEPALAELLQMQALSSLEHHELFLLENAGSNYEELLDEIFAADFIQVW